MIISSYVFDINALQNIRNLYKCDFFLERDVYMINNWFHDRKFRR